MMRLTPKCRWCGEHRSHPNLRKNCQIERAALIERARAEYGSDLIEVDDDAKLSRGGDVGTWVQAWVWVER